jgi:uncharacterized protein YjiS (DUF1127 family)
MSICTRAAAVLVRSIGRLRNIGLHHRNRSLLLAMDDKVFRDIGLSRIDTINSLRD